MHFQALTPHSLCSDFAVSSLKLRVASEYKDGEGKLNSHLNFHNSFDWIRG